MKKIITIQDLEQVPFTDDMIGNCFYVESDDSSLRRLKLSEIFDKIKKRSMNDEGLTVELHDDCIMFISGKK